MINILLWIVIGSMIMKTNSSQGVVADVILGILGAFVGGLVMNVLGFAGFTGFNVYSLVVATVGAVVLIALRRAIAT
jgi:uncharacterized membrane protein YeaQ/YmgE (transglycosylase-associated protein family)